jgi:hypothetical protein
MANDSLAAGFLTPIGVSPTTDDDLDNALHSTLAGVLGDIPKSFIRPRWQPEPPNAPQKNTNWVAFGVVRSEFDRNAAQRQLSSPSEGVTEVSRDELLYVLLSFYGPNAGRYEARFRDGMELTQNRDILRSLNVALVELQDPAIIPDLSKQTWVRKVEATMILRRRTVNLYQVRTLVGLSGSFLDNEEYLTPIVIPPAP